MEIEFIKLDSKPICGTLGCSNYASYICWTDLFNEPDVVEDLLVLRPLLICKSCLVEIGG